MSNKIGFLIDMDGVIYKGSQLIKGADRFIDHLLEENIPFTFLTNNSQRTRRDIVAKLNRMGINVTEEHVYTCAMATAQFVAQQKPKGTAFVIGEGGLLNALHREGYAIVDTDPDYVIIGEGRSLTLEMIEKAVSLIYKGAKLIATNLDPSCPIEGGIRPGCGAYAALLETATETEAFSVGKPSPYMMRAARKKLQLTTDQTIMIGDTMQTDILGAAPLGFKSILVLSGGTSKEELANFSYKPDLVVDSIETLLEEPFFDLDFRSKNCVL